MFNWSRVEGSAKVVCLLSGPFSRGRSLERVLQGLNEEDWPLFSNLRTLPPFGDLGPGLWLEGEDLVSSPCSLWSW